MNEKIYYVHGEDTEMVADENRYFKVGYFTTLDIAKVMAEKVAVKVSGVQELFWMERTDMRDDHLVWEACDGKEGGTYYVFIEEYPLNTIIHPDYK